MCVLKVIGIGAEWTVGAEVVPIALRSKLMGLAAASHFIVNVAVRGPKCPEIRALLTKDVTRSQKPAQAHLQTSNRTMYVTF